MLVCKKARWCARERIVASLTYSECGRRSPICATVDTDFGRARLDDGVLCQMGKELRRKPVEQSSSNTNNHLITAITATWQT
jgi:hypothetical protein